MLAGIVLSLAASPPVATRIGLDPFYFVNRHVLFLVPAVAVLLATSFLSPRQIRRVALVVFVVSLALVAATPFFGAEIKGARRWLVIARHQHPAVGIPQAGLRDPDRLAVRRIARSAGNAGQHHRAAAAADGGARCWCCSPTSARPC